MERALGNCFDGLIVGSKKLFLLYAAMEKENLLSLVMHVVEISN